MEMPIQLFPISLGVHTAGRWGLIVPGTVKYCELDQKASGASPPSLTESVLAVHELAIPKTSHLLAVSPYPFSTLLPTDTDHMILSAGLKANFYA